MSCEISGSCRRVDGVFALTVCYVAYARNIWEERRSVAKIFFSLPKPCPCRLWGKSGLLFNGQSPVEMWWNMVADGREREGETGEWSGQPVPFTLPRNMVYPALLPLIRTPQLPVVNWTDAPADLNGLVRFAERRNLVSERVPSHFKRSLPDFFLWGGGERGVVCGRSWPPSNTDV